MINTLNIGSLIYSKLYGLTNNVYPLIAENGTSYPFIIYSRDSVSPVYCKDGCYEDDVIATVKVVSNTYQSGIKLALKVREKLTFEDLTITTDKMIVTSALYSAAEGYEQDAYVQTLTFELKINNI